MLNCVEGDAVTTVQRMNPFEVTTRKRTCCSTITLLLYSQLKCGKNLRITELSLSFHPPNNFILYVENYLQCHRAIAMDTIYTAHFSGMSKCACFNIDESTGNQTTVPSVSCSLKMRSHINYIA